MAPLSVLPGRIRFGFPSLVGRKELCQFIEEEFGAIEGVLEVCANRRTGRVLVKFDERIVSQKTLAEQAAKITLTSKKGRNDYAEPLPWSGKRMSGKGGSALHPVGRLLFDLLMEALLPKALNMVLPAAVAVLRR